MSVPRASTYKGALKAVIRTRSYRSAVLIGLIGPLLTCALLVPLRRSIQNTDAALVLVVVIVAVSALGHRLAGMVAALSAGVWFDFFLTKPYEHFTIADRTDIETTVLLFVVGAAVTELAVWGRQQQHRAGQQAGYLTGLHAASEAMAIGGTPTRVVSQVTDQLTQVLNLQRCRFHYGSGLGNPRLQHDGGLTWDAAPWDIDADGLPPNHETELLVSTGRGYKGRFLMTPASGSRPTLTQRLVAVSLADQVGAALGEYDAEGDERG
jgi:K+-sensing histidine kinase KdpD